MREKIIVLTHLFMNIAILAVPPRIAVEKYLHESVPDKIFIPTIVFHPSVDLESQPAEIIIPAARAMFFNGKDYTRAIGLVAKYTSPSLLPSDLQKSLNELYACAYFYGCGLSQDMVLAHKNINLLRIDEGAGWFAQKFACQLMREAEIYCALQFATSCDSSFNRLLDDFIRRSLSDVQCVYSANVWQRYQFASQRPAIRLYLRALEITEDKNIWMHCKYQLMSIAYARKDYTAAEAYLNEALQHPEVTEDETAIIYRWRARIRDEVAITGRLQAKSVTQIQQSQMQSR